LLFKQTFSPLWSATLQNKGKVTTHFAADNTFNGWYIDQQGDYTITLSFGIQKYYIVGIVMSGLSILLLVSLFVIRKHI
jgi:hypothetical protein